MYSTTLYMVAAGDGRWVTAEGEAQVTGLVAREDREATRRRKFSPLQTAQYPTRPYPGPHACSVVCLLARGPPRVVCPALLSVAGLWRAAPRPAAPLARPLREDKSSLEATDYVNKSYGALTSNV